jgi:glutaredoxin 3
MEKVVTIYSTPVCHFCHMAKDFFAENNIVYTEHDVASDLEKRKEMVDLTGQMGVPVIRIDDDVVIGFDEHKVKGLLEI